MRAISFLIFSIIFLQFVFSEYTTIDGSELISLSYSPNTNYDASETVSSENLSQEMLSYYSWFASYGYCQEADIPLFCCTNYMEFFTGRWTMVCETSTTEYYTYNFVWNKE